MAIGQKHKKRTILAIHGAGMHGGIWGGLLPHLTEYYLRTPSLPGHDSDQPSDPLTTIEQMAAFIKPEIQTHDKGSLILLGHSMGALVALEAAKDPAVGAVVLLGAAAEMPVNPDLLKTAKENPDEAHQLIAKWSIPFAHSVGEALRTVMGAIQGATDPRAVYADLKACDDYKTGAATAGALQKPVLIITGEKDKMASPNAAHSLAEVLPKSRFELLDTCGHMSMIEKPIEVATLMDQFLKDEGF